MNKKHDRVLEAIFAIPVRPSINWRDIESLLVNIGASIVETRGSRIKVVLSRIKVVLSGHEAVFHRPHPQKETDKGALVSVRKFLEKAGVKPC